MNTQTITAANETFIVSAKMVAEGVLSPWADKKRGEQLVNKFRVSVKVGSKRTGFDFYGSINDYTHGVIELEDLKNAVFCFVSDACGANQSFENFCGEFGYDTDSRRTEKIYKECLKSLDKYNRLTSADIYDVANALNE